MNTLIQRIIGPVLALITYFLVVGALAAHATPTSGRIAVLPVYMNDAEQITVHTDAAHGREVLSYVRYWQMDKAFKLINPFETKAETQQILNLFSENRNNINAVSRQICYRYDLDAVVLVMLDTMALEFARGRWKATIRTRMEGFGRTGTSLGIADDEHIVAMDLDVGSALDEAQKELGYRIARTLAIQLGSLHRSQGTLVSMDTGHRAKTGFE